MHRLVLSGPPPGLLAYRDGVAVGWCAIGMRSDFEGLKGSRLLKPVDALPVWSLPCFFVAREHRRQGIMQGLIKAAVDHVRAAGGTTVEAYPRVPPQSKVRGSEYYTGFAATFANLGFVECAAPSDSRRIMRLHLV
jgi:GNAT superfamily N-acetyltransferase